MPKTVSARLENDVHDELLERCNKVGCRVSDFVKASVEFTLHGSVQFDFGDEEDDSEEASAAVCSASVNHSERSDNVGKIPRVIIHAD